MVVWGFTAGLLDAILEAAGWPGRGTPPTCARCRDSRDPRRYALPGLRDDEDEDGAAPTVADPAPDGPPTRTVPPR